MTGTHNIKDAIELSEDSNWSGLQELVEEHPLTAHQVDDYGMLPLHWACTEKGVPQTVLSSLLKAYPQAPVVLNKGKLLPLHIAIKAQANVEWIQALVAAYPESILIPTPSGEKPVELAQKFHQEENLLNFLREFEHTFESIGRDKNGKLNSNSSKHTSSSNLIVNKKTSDNSSNPYLSHKYSETKEEERSQLFRDNSSSALDKINHDSRSYSLTSEYPSVLHTDEQSIGSTISSTGFTNTSKRLSSNTSKTIFGKTMVSLPPRWMNAQMCHLCLIKFSAFKKRHHCRNCGQSICSDHSSKEKLALPHYGLREPERVCVFCFDQLKNRKHEMSLQSQSSQSFDFSNDFSHVENTRETSDSILKRHVSEPMYDNEPNNWMITLGNGHNGIIEQQQKDRKQEKKQKEKVSPRNCLAKFEFCSNRIAETTEVSTTYTTKQECCFYFSGPNVSNKSNSFPSSSPVSISPISEGKSQFDQGSLIPQIIDTSTENSFKEVIDSEDDIRSSEVDTLINLGIAMLTKGSSSGAVAAFTRAIELHPNDASLYLNLGKSLYADEDLDGAVAAIRHSLELYPTSATYTYLGKILFEKGDHDEAIKAYQQSLEIQRDDRIANISSHSVSNSSSD